MSLPQGERTFSYVARNRAGVRSVGKVEAKTRQIAKALIRSKGLHLVRLSDAPAVRGARRIWSHSTKQFSRRQEARFLGALAHLVGRQVPLERALSIMAESTDFKRAAAADRVQRSIREGATLSEALQQQGCIGDPVVSALISGGERSGALGLALAHASQVLNDRIEVWHKITSSLMYPLLLVFVAITSILLMLLVIVPEFRPIVESRIDLVPTLGQIVFLISDYLVHFWTYFIVLVFTIFTVLIYLHLTGSLAPRMVGIARYVPFVGRVLNSYRAMLIARLLGVLLEREIPLSEALKTVSETPIDSESSLALAAVKREVEEGSDLSKALESHGVLSTDAIELLRLGEEMRTLGAMLNLVADDIKEHSERQLKRFLSLLEPGLILAVGTVIGVCLYALFSAMVSVNALSF